MAFIVSNAWKVEDLTSSQKLFQSFQMFVAAEGGSYNFIGKQLSVISNEEIAEVLESIADTIEENKWIQNNLFSADGGMCWVGAAEHYGNSVVVNVAYTCMKNYVRSLGYPSIPKWNDSEIMTKELILKETRLVADKIRHGEDYLA